MSQASGSVCAPQGAALQSLHELYVCEVRPRITRMARRRLWRLWGRPEEFDSALADAYGNGWVFLLRAYRRGKDLPSITGLLAAHALRHAAGRRSVTGTNKASCCLEGRMHNRPRRAGDFAVGLIT